MNTLNVTASNALEYYEKVVAITSALAPQESRLTDTEVHTLAFFLNLPPSFDYYPFSPKARKLLYSSYTGKTPIQALSARVVSLIKKGYLVKDEDGFIDFVPSIKKLRRARTLNVSLSHKLSNPQDSTSNVYPKK